MKALVGTFIVDCGTDGALHSTAEYWAPGRSPVIMTTPGHTSLVTLRSILQRAEDRRQETVCCVVHCGLYYYCIIWNTNIELWRDIACCCWTLQRTTQEKCSMIHTAGAEAGIWIKLSISKTIKLHFSPHHIPSYRDGLAQPPDISFLQQTSYFCHPSDGNRGMKCVDKDCRY